MVMKTFAVIGVILLIIAIAKSPALLNDGSTTVRDMLNLIK